MTKRHKKLTRDNKNKMITGLIAGVGNYLDVDPTLLRIIWILSSAITGFVPGMIAYFVVSFIVPQK